MSKFDHFDSQKQKSKQKGPHPIWRGIGCLMIIIIPIMAYAAADLFLQAAPGMGLFPQAADIYQNIDLKYFVLPFSLGEAIFTVFFAVLGFMIFAFLYTFAYRVAGPPKYGPTDAPPPKPVKKKRR